MVRYEYVAIAKDPGTCDGKPYIIGTDIKVQCVYIWHQFMGMSVEDIAQQHSLSKNQVLRALEYANKHVDEIQMAIHDEVDFLDQFYMKG